MKNLIKKNLIAVFAVLLTVGTMSFKMIEKSKSTPLWYTIEDDGELVPTGFSGTPNEEDCNTDNTVSVCAIYMELDQENPFPATLSEAERDHIVTIYAHRQQE